MTWGGVAAKDYRSGLRPSDLGIYGPGALPPAGIGCAVGAQDDFALHHRLDSSTVKLIRDAVGFQCIL